MNNTLTIAWKELKIYFLTPTAYVVAAMFVVFAGITFILNVIGTNPEATVRSFVVPSSIFYILLAPLLTMRLLVRDWEVVLGKYIASLIILIATLAATLYYVIMIYAFGEPDSGPVMSAYLGMILYGAAALAIGMLASSLTSNQIVSAVLGMGTLLILTFIDTLGMRLGGVTGDIILEISMRTHFGDFARGIVDTSHIVYYLSMIAVFLFLAVRSVETRRWR